VTEDVAAVVEHRPGRLDLCRGVGEVVGEGLVSVGATVGGEVADRLKKLIAELGGAAVLPYSYAGTEGLVQHDALSSRFFARLGAVPQMTGASWMNRPLSADLSRTGHPLTG
jgi:hypothetical protein